MLTPRLLSCIALILAACVQPATPEDTDTDTDTDTGGDTGTDPIEVMEPDSRAGCTYDQSFDEGDDGEDDSTEHMEWDARINADGDEEETEYSYEHIDGDYEVYSANFDDNLCELSYQLVTQVDGESDGYRTASTCDAWANWLELERSELVNGDWEAEYERSYTNSYDASDHLTEQERTTVHSDPELEDYTLLFVHEYDGDLYEGVEVFIDGESYYWVDYTWDEEGNLEGSVLYLGDYFGSSAGTIYQEMAYTYNAAGKVLTVDYTDSNPDEDYRRVYTRDPWSRIITQEYWSDGEGAHDLDTISWDPDFYRYTQWVSEDLTGEASSATTTYEYDGPWPWTGSARRVYDDGETPDDSVSFSYDCP